MAKVDQELLRMSETLRVLEDEREIIQLISSYGPAVDSGQSEAAAAIWTEDGVYDTDAVVWRGQAEIAAMVESAPHQQLIAEGAAHVIGVPHVRITGHRAVATCYSRVFRHVEGRFEVWRVAVNRWARPHAGGVAGQLPHQPPDQRLRRRPRAVGAGRRGLRRDNGDVKSRPGVTVRAARDDDDLDAMNAGNPCWMGAAMTRALFAATGEASGVLVAEADGEPIGYGDFAALAVMDGHRAPMSVYVRPADRRRGAATALWGVILEACRPDRVHGVLTQADGDDSSSHDVALAHGFQLGGLHIESALALDDADNVATATRAHPPAGVSLGALPPSADESLWHGFAALFERLERDTPDLAEGSEPTPYAVLRTFLPEPWQVMGAWDGGEMVGFTAVAVREAGTRTLNTVLTGVLPEYRGRGVATALKAAHAVALGGAGWRTIRTQNMEGNLPILASNTTLGFRRVRALQDLVYDHPASAQPAAKRQPG